MSVVNYLQGSSLKELSHYEVPPQMSYKHFYNIVFVRKR